MISKYLSGKEVILDLYTSRCLLFSLSLISLLSWVPSPLVPRMGKLGLLTLSFHAVLRVPSRAVFPILVLLFTCRSPPSPIFIGRPAPSVHLPHICPLDTPQGSAPEHHFFLVILLPHLASSCFVRGPQYPSSCLHLNLDFSISTESSPNILSVLQGSLTEYILIPLLQAGLGLDQDHFSDVGCGLPHWPSFLQFHPPATLQNASRQLYFKKIVLKKEVNGHDICCLLANDLVNTHIPHIMPTKIDPGKCKLVLNLWV